MHVYPADLADLNRCCQLNGTYSTDYVWQMQTREGEHRTDIRFDTVRLPRSMQVAYPRPAEELPDHWQAEHCFLVAAPTDDEVAGFIDAHARPDQQFLWVYNLIVDKRYRRQGVGSLLLESAGAWAEAQHLETIMLEIQTNNHPAIAFARKHGIQSYGYHERY